MIGSVRLYNDLRTMAHGRSGWLGTPLETGTSQLDSTESRNRVRSCNTTFPAEQKDAADCLQHTLVPRSRFQQRLILAVDRTSDVKSKPPMFTFFTLDSFLDPLEEPEPVICDG